MAIPRWQITLEDFLKRPEEEPALEFEEGAITQKVSPKGPHATLQSELSDRINRFAKPHRLARAYTELRTTYSGASRVPDLAVYRWERIPTTSQGRVALDFTLPPDIAIEIASPGQRMAVLIRHCLWYVANGVRVALLVDPEDESVFVFRPNTIPVVVRGAACIDLDDVLPGFELTAQELFDELNV